MKTGIISGIPEIASKFRFWGNKKILRTCLNAGHEIAETAKRNNGNLTLAQLNEIYKRFLPKGCNVNAINDPQAVSAFFRNLHFDEDTISFISTRAQALVIKNFKGEMLFFVPIEHFKGDKAVNTATHELEHVLNGKTSLRGKIQDFLMKILGPKRVEKITLKDNSIINVKLLNLQQNLMGQRLKIYNPLDKILSQNADKKGLLEYLGLSSEKRLRAQLRSSVRRILDPKSEKKNIKYLKLINLTLADEARAYRAGGEAAKEYLDLKTGSTATEMVAQIYDETRKVMQQEIKAQRIKRLKRFLGFNVHNYEGPKRLKATDIK